MVYATRVHVQEMEQNIFVIVASSNAPSAQYESAGIVLSRAGAEDLLKNLSEALKPRETRLAFGRLWNVPTTL